MLLTTKLYTPTKGRQLVSRPRLIEKLNAGLDSRVILVAAPAGFGKSSLVSEWIHSQPLIRNENTRATPITHSIPQFCWLSLDENDNDPIRFLRYWIAALQRVDVTLGTAALNLLQASQAPPLTVLLTLLLNDISAAGHLIVLVLDDYHLITALPIHDALTFFVEHMPPTMHLVITSRSDPPLPLARWRARRDLTEIRVREIRFTLEETAAFLQQELNTELTPDDITTLTERTEGWVAGLQLAALSLSTGRNAHHFIQAFSGSHVYIVDYLVEEVLRRQPPAITEVMLKTSLLERFTAPLCDTLTGEQNGRAVLNYLEHNNLFLIALDDQREWVRYHHLFRDLLQQRLRDQLSAAAVNELHERAADWYAAQSLPDEAIHHYLAAGAVHQAADIIEAVGYELIGQGYLSRLRTWLAKLPMDLVRLRPRLVLWQAWVLNLTGQPAALEEWLQEAEFSLEHVPAAIAQDMQAQIITLHAYKTRRAGNLAAAIAQLQQALAHCAPENLLTRTAINLNLGFNYGMTGQFPLADQTLQAIQQDANIIGAIHMLLLAKATQASVALAQGKLRRAMQLCQEAIDDGFAYNAGTPFTSAGYAYAVLGGIYYELNDLAQAEQALEQAIALGDLTADGTVIRRAIFRLALLKQLAGDDAAVETLWQRAVAAEDTVEEPLVMLQQVRSWLVQAARTADADALGKATQWAATYSERQPDTNGYLSALAQTLIAWVELLQGEPAQALARLAPLLESAADQIHHLLEMQLLHALAHESQGDGAAATVHLMRALEIAAPEGYIRLFVDHGKHMHKLMNDVRSTIADLTVAHHMDKVLAAFSHPSDPLVESPAHPHTQPTISREIPRLIEPLSERELEILHLVADGDSNSQIALRLIITVGTVKKHLNNIFGKLGVSSRTQALARARELELL